MALAAALAFTGCKDAANPTESATNAFGKPEPGQVKILPALTRKPKPFCALTGECALPDDLALDGQGNILL